MPTSRLAPVLCLCLCAIFSTSCAKGPDATPSPEVVTQVKLERVPIDASVLAGCPDEPAQPPAGAAPAAQYGWLYDAVQAGRACRIVVREVGRIVGTETATQANSGARQ